MSFLDAVLSSIGTGTSTPLNPVKEPIPARRHSTSASLPVKRKAEEDPKQPSDKRIKTERTSDVRSVDRPIRPLSVTKQNSATPIKTPFKTPTKTVTAATIAPTTATTQPAQVSGKNPKKGSFAAIMARAKEAQAQPANNTGSIMHKPKEKTKAKTHKELVMEREAAKKAAKKGIPFAGLAGSKNSVGKDSSKKSTPEKGLAGQKKGSDAGTAKPVEKSGYQGTMQPSTSSRYAGTARPQASSAKSRTDARNPASAKPRQVSTRRERELDSEDEESDDGYDYASEDYSDMDAGFDDMEDEEEQAARIARREDAAAQAELDRLKREKEQKKLLLSKGKR